MNSNRTSRGGTHSRSTPISASVAAHAASYLLFAVSLVGCVESDPDYSDYPRGSYRIYAGHETSTGVGEIACGDYWGDVDLGMYFEVVGNINDNDTYFLVDEGKYWYADSEHQVEIVFTERFASEPEEVTFSGTVESGGRWTDSWQCAGTWSMEYLGPS